MHTQGKLQICITGPTATGKTDVAVQLCHALGGEVISMDSMQIYEGLDIGTAKASVHEMDGVPHHLLSFVSPDRAYSVAEYQQDASRIAQEVCGRGHVPVFCGGTGLYLQAISRPLSFSDTSGDEPFRRALEAEAAEEGGGQALHKRLAAIDPISAERIHPGNVRRVIRALEIHHLTGKPMSEREAEWDKKPSPGFVIFALTYPRDVLYARINTRVERMMEHGLVEEVQKLLSGGLARSTQSMQAIGYKEIIAALLGECTMEEAVSNIQMNSRRYAKRQLSWLRRDPHVQWLDMGELASIHSAKNAIMRAIEKCRNE